MTFVSSMEDLRERGEPSRSIRKTLQRARERFARLLIREVSHSLEVRDDDVVESELSTLGLLPYCRRELGE